MCVCVCGVLIQSELLTSPGSKQVMEIISAFCFGAERIESSQISVNSHTWIQSAYYFLIQQFHFVAHLLSGSVTQATACIADREYTGYSH